MIAEQEPPFPGNNSFPPPVKEVFMASFLKIPRLYPEMEEATVGRWIAHEGDTIPASRPVVEIITDKVSYEIEAPDDPVTLIRVCAAEKTVLAVGSVVAILGRPGESADSLPDWQRENEAIAAERAASLAHASPLGAAPRGAGPLPETTPTPSERPAGVIRATPAARRAARAAGASLEEIAAASAGETVTEADVERFLAGRRTR